MVEVAAAAEHFQEIVDFFLNFVIELYLKAYAYLCCYLSESKILSRISDLILIIDQYGQQIKLINRILKYKPYFPQKIKSIFQYIFNNRQLFFSK